MKVLLPVDSSDASIKAVQFAANLAIGQKTGVSITLLHIAESIPDYLLAQQSVGDSQDMYRKVAEDWEKNQTAAGEALLEKAKKALVSAGISAGSVTSKLIVRECRPESRKVVAAISIIEEMNDGDYSVVCLGRRGSSAAQGSFLGSVAEKVLREANGRTVCVVD